MYSLAEMLVAIRSIHEQIRDAVVAATEASRTEELARVVEDGEGDTIYVIDRISEDLLVALFEREVAAHTPIVLIAEGLAEGKIVLPRGTLERNAKWRVIADPIDGTRCLMYQKRSGWIFWRCSKSRRSDRPGRYRTGSPNRNSPGQATPERLPLGSPRRRRCCRATQ